MMWNNMPCHHKNLLFYFFIFLDHGIMESWIVFFVTSCCDKITCHEKNLIKKKLSKENFDTICHNVHMFTNYIYTKYVYACIHQGLNPRPYGNTPRF